MARVRHDTRFRDSRFVETGLGNAVSRLGISRLENITKKLLFPWYHNKFSTKKFQWIFGLEIPSETESCETRPVLDTNK